MVAKAEPIGQKCVRYLQKIAMTPASIRPVHFLHANKETEAWALDWMWWRPLEPCRIWGLGQDVPHHHISSMESNAIQNRANCSGQVLFDWS